MATRRVIIARPKYRSVFKTRPVTAPLEEFKGVQRHRVQHTQHPPLKGGVCAEGLSESSGKTVDELCDDLAVLPAGDRKKLLDRLLLASRLDEAKPAHLDLEMWSVAVHQELCHAVGSLDGGIVGPALVRKLVAVGTSWKPVQSFMEAARLSELTAPERQVAYNLLAKLLVRHAREVARRSGAPLSAKLVSQCTGNLMGVFENNFPGYLAAGLARVVTRQAAIV